MLEEVLEEGMSTKEGLLTAVDMMAAMPATKTKEPMMYPAIDASMKALIVSPKAFVATMSCPASTYTPIIPM